MSDYTVANVRALARVGQTPPNRISYPCRYPRRNRLRGCLVLVFLAETRLEGSRRNLSSMLAETHRGTDAPRDRRRNRGYPSINRRLTAFAETRPMLEGPRLDSGHCPSRNYSQLRRRNTRD